MGQHGSAWTIEQNEKGSLRESAASGRLKIWEEQLT